MGISENKLTILLEVFTMEGWQRITANDITIHSESFEEFSKILRERLEEMIDYGMDAEIARENAKIKMTHFYHSCFGMFAARNKNVFYAVRDEEWEQNLNKFAKVVFQCLLPAM